MKKVAFFSGKQVIERFHIFKRHKDKERLYCTVEEEWREKFADSATCGIPLKLNLKRTVGVSVSERQELEATVSSKFGVKGMSEVSSAIKGTLGHEIRLDETLEEARDLTLPTPKCGRFTLQIFQLHQLYNLEYRDERFFRRKKSFRTITERLNRWWQVPDIIPSIPECKCGEDIGKAEGGILRRLGLAFEKFGMVVDCLQTEDSVALPPLGLSFSVKSVEDLIGQAVVVQRADIPEHLLFLSAETAEEFKGSFVASEPILMSRQVEERITGETGESLAKKIVGLAVLVGIGVVASIVGRRSSQREEEANNDASIDSEVLRASTREAITPLGRVTQ
jgi:hypothetical protein